MAKYSSSSSSKDTGWRTINGAHVLIGKDGTISKGPKSMMGKSVSEIQANRRDTLSMRTKKGGSKKSTKSSSKSKSKGDRRPPSPDAEYTMRQVESMMSSRGLYPAAIRRTYNGNALRGVTRSSRGTSSASGTKKTSTSSKKTKTSTTKIKRLPPRTEKDIIRDGNIARVRPERARLERIWDYKKLATKTEKMGASLRNKQGKAAIDQLVGQIWGGSMPSRVQDAKLDEIVNKYGSTSSEKRKLLNYFDAKFEEAGENESLIATYGKNYNKYLEDL